jgi:hypothetical protein
MSPLILALLLAGSGAGAPVDAAPESVLTGRWGGDRLVAEFSLSGARIEQDCAEGVIPAPVRTDASGRFVADGSYQTMRPGPHREGDEAPSATYSGEIAGATMRLTIRPAAGGPARSYILQRDVRVKLVRCY